MNFNEWIETVPIEIRSDPLWSLKAYRFALFASELGWHDVTKLYKDRRTSGLSEQLFDALGSIGANISEGYSRGHFKDRARFYEYALGSARESRSWYFNARFLLGEVVAQHRIQLMTQIIKLLLTILPDTRGYALHENHVVATSMAFTDDTCISTPTPDLDNLVSQIPLP